MQNPSLSDLQPDVPGLAQSNPTVTPPDVTLPYMEGVPDIERPYGAADEPPAQARWIMDGDIAYWNPTPDEKRDIDAHFLSEIREAELNHAGFYERLARNDRAHEAIPDFGSGDKLMYVLPIVQRDCEQQTAYFVNTAMRPHPVWTFQPVFAADYKVPIADPTFGSVMLDATAEQVAAAAERAIDHIWRDRIGFMQLCNDVFGETVRGRGPAIVKCVYDERYHTEYAHRIEQSLFNQPNYAGVEEFRAPLGDPVRIYTLPAEHFLMGADDEDTLTAEWVSERRFLSDYLVKLELQQPGNLILESRVNELLQAKGDNLPAFTKEMKSVVDGRAPRAPRNRHDVREVWFIWMIDGVPTRLCGQFHMGIGEFIWIAKNWYHHQRNPYVAFFQRKKAFRFADKGTAELLAPIQTLISEILHLALQNAAIANSTPIVADPTTEAFDWLSKNEVDSGSLIPGHKDDVGTLDFGREHRTMMPEVDWLMDTERTISGVSTYRDGSVIPGRTSPNTVQQILQSGAQVPLFQLANYGESFKDLFWLWMRTYKQYKPYGEVLYVQDAKERAMLEVPFLLPDEALLGNFRCTLTAADEAAAAETAIDQLVNLAHLLDQDADKVAQIIGPMANMSISDSMSAILETLINRKQELIQLIVDKTRTDGERFIVGRDLVKSVQEERKLAVQRAQQQAAVSAQSQPPGGMNGSPQVQPPGAGGAGPQAGPSGVGG